MVSGIRQHFTDRSLIRRVDRQREPGLLLRLWSQEAGRYENLHDDFCLEPSADGMLHMNLTKAKSNKRRRAGENAAARAETKGKGCSECKAVQNYTLTSLDDCKQIDLRAECALHDLPTYGDNTQLKNVLKAHYNACTHSHKPGGAAPDRAAAYYNTKTSDERRDAWRNASIANFFVRMDKKV